jgi:hypothetical protein
MQMKAYWFSTIAGTGVLLFSLAAGQATAQYRDDDSWHHNRDGYYNRGQEWRMHLFDRVRQDLDHIQSAGFSWGDRKRVDRAMTELNDLQSKLSQRQYDQPELDDSIGAIQEVVQDNRLGPHDRDMLTEDLNRMREYREHHTDWR